MTPLSEAIFANWQIRKTKKQKTAFIDFMQNQIPELKVEQGGFGNNRNLVLGDVKTADVILGAHYDTCAQLPFPNFLTPKNLLLYLGYALLICIPFYGLAYVIGLVLGTFGPDFPLLSLFAALLPLILLFWMFMGGKPNPHTANDNTSGVITLCEIWAAMTAEQRAKTAFVFFDNEENGLLGSSYFCKLHKKDGVANKLMINFDCVSDGDHMLFVLSKKAKDRYAEAFAAAFPATEDKAVYIECASNTMYPSDQAGFALGVGVAAMKKKKGVGLYMNKIHTIHDTVFQRENIAFFTAGTLRLLEKLRGEGK